MKASDKLGWFYLFLWAALIVIGIVAKRLYGHPDWMVFFHGPAAVFLVMAFYRLSAPFREIRMRELQWNSRPRTKDSSQNLATARKREAAAEPFKQSLIEGP